MGRWVTSKGRRIYIPDPGEENPYAKGTKNNSLENSINEHIKTKKDAIRTINNLRPKDNASSEQWRAYGETVSTLTRKFNLSKNEQKGAQIDKEESVKQRQITRNKEEADKLNNDMGLEVLGLSKELNKNKTATTTNKRIADMYKKNKNPNFDFSVTTDGNSYIITAKKRKRKK